MSGFRFDIEGKPHVLRFVEALSTVLINGQPIKVEFGGLPKPIVVRGKKHFIRFTVLPRGIRPGYISIVNMEGGRLPSPPRPKNENSDSIGFGEDSSDAPSKFTQGHDPVLPVVGKCFIFSSCYMDSVSLTLERKVEISLKFKFLFLYVLQIFGYV